MSGKNPVASAVNFILFYFIYFQAGGFKKIFKRRIMIELKMFVAKISKVVIFNHRLGGHKLGDENSVLVQNIFGVGNKLKRVFQIVKHSDSGDDFGFLFFLINIFFASPEIMQSDISVFPKLAYEII